jgi:aminocarboxymuconate-semialdehyde decarboxylase
MTVENVLDAHHKAGIDVSLVSNAAHYLRGKAEKEELAAIRRWSDYAAEIQATHKGTLYALATILPCGGPAYLREVERAIVELELKGLFINSSHKGHYPDDDEARPFWELAQELDVPVMIHPPHVGFGEERMRDYRLASSVGRPMDGALAIARMIVRGVLEKFPTLKVVGTHLGGGICEMIGRMDYAYTLGDEVYFLGRYEPMLINHKPSHYLKMMYLESTSYWVPGARCALESVGADHFIFGTDAPPLKSLKAEGVELIKKLGLSPEDERKVYCENARKLLKI